MVLAARPGTGEHLGAAASTASSSPCHPPAHLQLSTEVYRALSEEMRREKSVSSMLLILQSCCWGAGLDMGRAEMAGGTPPHAYQSDSEGKLHGLFIHPQCLSVEKTKCDMAPPQAPLIFREWYIKFCFSWDLARLHMSVCFRSRQHFCVLYLGISVYNKTNIQLQEYNILWVEWFQRVLQPIWKTD